MYKPTESNTPKPGFTKTPLFVAASQQRERPPLRAAQGDDDLMSQPQQPPAPSADQAQGKWKQQVGAAKSTWGKLTEDEILRSEGSIQKLAGLVHERYAVTLDDAESQVMRFFDKQSVS